MCHHLQRPHTPGLLAFLFTLYLVWSGAPVALADRSGPQLQATWTIWRDQTVDAPKRFSISPHSLRLDASGRPHLAYGGDHLYYAWQDDVGWHLETVDAADGVGDYASLALDSTGAPHISYYDRLNGDLKYAFWNGSRWTIETVDSTGDVGQYTSLALDDHNSPRISYYDATNRALRYARWRGADWSLSTVDGSGNTGLSTSLALDGSGAPHISYRNTAYGELRYARWDGSQWVIETVDSGDVYMTSLALDHSDHPHILYTGYDGASVIKYAHWTGSVWTKQVIDEGFWAGGSLALDSQDRPCFSYVKTSLVPDTGAWEPALIYDGTVGASRVRGVVAGVGFAAWESSLALGRDDQPYMAYALGASLMYAERSSTGWKSQKVDEGGDVGAYASLALDASGRPHIGYTDTASASLKYASWVDGDWEIQIVDPGTTSGTINGVSLALDSQGRPHISYFRDGSFRYARWTGVAWVIETVMTPNPLVNSNGTSIALDHSDIPQVFYSYQWYDSINDNDGNVLAHAQWSAQGWVNEIVTNNHDWASVYQGISAATDGTGVLHLSYCNIGKLLHARSNILGGGWQVEQAGDMSDSCGFTSLVLDDGNDPRIAYFEANSKDLKYARKMGDSWKINTVDGAGDVGSYPSLALDASGAPHISYYDATYSRLKYAYWTGSNWWEQAIGVSGSVGPYSSLALDDAQKPHIAYFDPMMGDLKYAFGDPAAHIAFLPLAKNTGH
jgi:hypothetical protein